MTALVIGKVRNAGGRRTVRVADTDLQSALNILPILWFKLREILMGCRMLTRMGARNDNAKTVDSIRIAYFRKAVPQWRLNETESRINSTQNSYRSRL